MTEQFYPAEPLLHFCVHSEQSNWKRCLLTTQLIGGLVVSALGLVFGLVIYQRLRKMPVHTSMLEVSELIYEICKTYLATQGKFLMLLECFIAVIIVFYFGFLQGFALYKVAIILAFSVIGISGSFCVAAFGMRVNTFANSRTSFAALPSKPYPSSRCRMSIGMAAGIRRTAHHVVHPAVHRG